VVIYQSRFFTEWFPEENARFRNVEYIDGVSGDREASLLCAADKIALHRPAGSFPPNNNYYRISEYLTFRSHWSVFVPSNFLLAGFRIAAFAFGYIGATQGSDVYSKVFEIDESRRSPPVLS
jgi:hypothetical protein